MERITSKYQEMDIGLRNLFLKQMIIHYLEKQNIGAKK